MEWNRPYGRAAIVTLMVLGTLFLHYFTFRDIRYYHAVFRMLFYVPLILGAFWFGIKGSLAVCIGVVALYAPYLFRDWNGLSANEFDRLLEGVLFVVISVILGLLVEKERKGTQALLEARSLAAVGKAVTEIAHDMKTPLMAIGGFVTQVARGLPEKEANRKKLEIVVDETSRLERMVKSMLEFGRPVELEVSNIDPNKGVREVLDLVAGSAEKGGITLHADLDPELPLVMADNHKVNRVFLNLVSNAVQATEEGGDVWVTTRPEKGKVVFQVKDNGCGIQEGHEESVFHPFFTTKKSGTGLGLGIAKKIVEAHGGEISFRPNRDRGVTFTVKLPPNAIDSLQQNKKR
ncbi:MAG: GHKL domain-containing protein [Deltaproteobacteria bacterium]|nr:GHKL domain-containing protein [Deltaproteobacteria bacterium]